MLGHFWVRRRSVDTKRTLAVQAAFRLLRRTSEHCSGGRNRPVIRPSTCTRNSLPAERRVTMRRRIAPMGDGRRRGCAGHRHSATRLDENRSEKDFPDEAYLPPYYVHV